MALKGFVLPRDGVYIEDRPVGHREAGESPGTRRSPPFRPFRVYFMGTEAFFIILIRMSFNEDKRRVAYTHTHTHTHTPTHHIQPHHVRGFSIVLRSL